MDMTLIYRWKVEEGDGTDLEDGVIRRYNLVYDREDLVFPWATITKRTEAYALRWSDGKNYSARALTFYEHEEGVCEEFNNLLEAKEFCEKVLFEPGFEENLKGI